MQMGLIVRVYASHQQIPVALKTQARSCHPSGKPCSQPGAAGGQLRGLLIDTDRPKCLGWAASDVWTFLQVHAREQAKLCEDAIRL